MKKILFILLLFVLACSKKESNSKNMPIIKKKIKNVIVKNFIPKDVEFKKYYNSFIKPKRKIYLSSQSSGIITKLNFDIGDRVKKGKILAIIDNRIKKNDMNMKKIILNEAKHNLDYQKTLVNKDEILFKNKVINKEKLELSKNRLKNLEFNYKKANASYELSRILYKNTFIRAPFTGFIVKKNKELADMINISGVIGELIDEELSLMIGVSLDDLKQIINFSKDRKINIYDKNNNVCKGKISKISKLVDNITRLYPIKIDIKNCNFMQDTQVRVEIPIKVYKNSFKIDSRILELKDDDYFIYLLKDNKAQKTKIELLERENNYSIIKINSHKKSFNVIVGGYFGLKNNQQVKIKEKKHEIDVKKVNKAKMEKEN